MNATAAAMMVATHDHGIDAPPILKPVAAHGMPRPRLLMLTASVPTVRSTASRPSVITAIENSGSPIIGRMMSRSMTRPRSTASSRPVTTAENHTTYVLPPEPLARGPPSRRAPC